MKSTVRLFGHAVPPAPSGTSVSSATLSTPPGDTRIAPSNAPRSPPPESISVLANSELKAPPPPTAPAPPSRNWTAPTRDWLGVVHLARRPHEPGTIAARRCGSLRCDDVETKTSSQFTSSPSDTRAAELVSGRSGREIARRVSVSEFRRGSPTGLTPRGRNDGETARSRASTLPRGTLSGNSALGTHRRARGDDGEPPPPPAVT